MDHNRITFYLAEVVETQLGDSKLEIKVRCQLHSWDSTIAPLFSGVSIFPAPEVGDVVLVFVADYWNQHELYIPVQKDLQSLTPNPTDLLVENNQGNIHINGTEILLGSAASDYVALAADVKSQLDSIQSAITSLASDFNAHTHISAAPSSPTSSPVIPTTASYTAAEVAAVKTKAE